MAKIYGIDGYSTASYIFGLGKAKPFRAEFTGGRPDLDGKHPATYIAKSDGQAIAIEHSTYFKKGLIYLYRDTSKPATGRGSRTIVMGAAPAPAPVQQVEAEEAYVAPVAASADVEEHPEITSREEAVAFLKGMGVKAASLRSNEAIARAAAKNNVSFPNIIL